MGTLDEMGLTEFLRSGFGRWCRVVNEVGDFFYHVDANTWLFSNAMFPTLHPDLALLYEMIADYPAQPPESPIYDEQVTKIRAELERCRAREDEGKK